MAVSLVPARGDRPYAREGGSEGVPASPARGILDFGSVMKHRGLLDAQALAAADPLSSATRFDEGPLFGRATAARREPVERRGEAETGKGHCLKAATLMRGEIRGQVEAPAFLRSGEIARGLGSLVVDERVAGVRFDNSISDTRALNDLAVNIAGINPAMSGGKIEGDAGARTASPVFRAHQRNMPSFVHVIASKGADGVELAVRIAGVSAAEADELERRLRETAMEDGASVKAMRLNGADRLKGMGGSKDG